MGARDAVATAGHSPLVARRRRAARGRREAAGAARRQPGDARRSRPRAASPSACSTRTRRSRSSARACSRPRATTRRASRSIAAAARRAATPRTSRSARCCSTACRQAARRRQDRGLRSASTPTASCTSAPAIRNPAQHQEAHLQVIGAPTVEDRMSVRTDVLLWAQRVIATKGGTRAPDPRDRSRRRRRAAQEAFHKIARIAHPDLHRNGAQRRRARAGDERVCARCRRLPGAARPAGLDHPHEADPRAWIGAGDRDDHGASRRRRSPNKAVAAPRGTAPALPPAMASKALVHYRKAELCLRRGDLNAGGPPAQDGDRHRSALGIPPQRACRDRGRSRAKP